MVNYRPETGPMKFENDWTGLFIRGDNCLHYKIQLETLQSELERLNLDDNISIFAKIAMNSLISLLSSTNEFNKDENCQKLKSFENCNLK